MEHDITVQDPRLARIVRHCQELPGQELFQYQDADGEVRRIGSGEVNDYISEAAACAVGQRFTAKDFRTWHGSALALELACEAGDEAFAVKPALAEVARRLRNTPAVCRASYIHPRVLEAWQRLASAKADEAGPIRAQICGNAESLSRVRMPVAEQRLLQFLVVPARERRMQSAA